MGIHWLANAVVARASMLPSLHAVEVWVFGHNRVHHGHTLRQGMPVTVHLPLDQTPASAQGGMVPGGGGSA